ncbi:MAG: MATE family efflux transporter [Dongiaceae bacterium]
MTTTSPGLRVSAARMHGAILAIALPAICANFTMVLPGLVDTAFIGQLGIAAALGGVSIGSTLCGFVLWAFSFLRMGTAGFTAQAYGARDNAELRACFLRSLLLAILFGILLLILMVPLGKLGLLFFAPGPAVADYARRYYHFRLFSAPFDLMLFVVLGWLLGTQRAVLAMMLQILLNLLNVALCWLFVIRLQMNVVGAGLATALSQTVTACIGLVIVFAILRRTGFREKSATRLFDAAKLIRIMSVNRDIFIRTFALLAVFSYFVRLGAQFGDVTLAANHILFGFLSAIAQGLDGFAQSAETLTGQAIGARDPLRLRAVTRLSSLWAGGLAVLMSLALWLAGPALLPIFTNEADVLATAAQYFPWIALTPVAAVACYQLDGIYIGATRGRELRNGMLIATIVALGAEALLAPLYGNHGLWFALICLFLLRAATLLAWYPRIPRQLALSLATPI